MPDIPEKPEDNKDSFSASALIIVVFGWCFIDLLMSAGAVWLSSLVFKTEARPAYILPIMVVGLFFWGSLVYLSSPAGLGHNEQA